MIRLFSVALLALAALAGVSRATHVVRVRQAVVVRPFVSGYNYGYSQNFVAPVYAAPVVAPVVSGCDYGTQPLVQGQAYSAPAVGAVSALGGSYAVSGFSAGYSQGFTRRVLVRPVVAPRVFVRQPVVVRRPVVVRQSVFGRGLQLRVPGLNLRLFR